MATSRRRSVLKRPIYTMKSESQTRKYPKAWVRRQDAAFPLKYQFMIFLSGCLKFNNILILQFSLNWHTIELRQTICWATSTQGATNEFAYHWFTFRRYRSIA